MPAARTVGDGPPAPPPCQELCQSPQLYYSPASPSLSVLSSASHAHRHGACAVLCRGARSWLSPHGACRHARRVCRVPRVLGKWQPCLSQQVLGSTQKQNPRDGLGTRPCRFFRAWIYRPANTTQPCSRPQVSDSAALAGDGEETPRRSSSEDRDGHGDVGSVEEMGEELSDGAGVATKMGSGGITSSRTAGPIPASW